jgi:hypothetical protein
MIQGWTATASMIISLIDLSGLYSLQEEQSQNRSNAFLALCNQIDPKCFMATKYVLESITNI